MSQTKKEDLSINSSQILSKNWKPVDKLLDLQVGDRVLYCDRSLGTVTFKTEGCRTHSRSFPEQLTITLDGQQHGICIFEYCKSDIKYDGGTGSSN